MDQIRRVAEAGADIVRVAVPREQDVEALKTIVRESPIPVIADIHFNHTLAIKAHRGRRALRADQPGQHRRPGEDRRGHRGAPSATARRCASASTPARCPSTCATSSSPTRSRRSSRAAIEYGRADGAPGLPRLQGLDEVDVACRTRSPPTACWPSGSTYPLHLGVTEAGTKWSGSLKSAVGLGHAAGRRDRRHDPHLALDLPRRGGGQGRLGDPQGAEAARARAGADRLPDVRAPAVRHGLGRRRGRAAPGGLRGPDRGLGPRLRGQRHRRGAPRRLRHHRRQGHGR